MTTGRRTKKEAKLDELRGKMQLLMAAGAVFVLLMGLTFLVFQIVVLKSQNTFALMLPFLAFFLVGITLLMASTFLGLSQAKLLLAFGSKLSGKQDS